MSNSTTDRIKDKISARHGDDESQLQVIFSPHKRILVEAPAGYGKTNTMVSKIAYMLATGQVPYPKRLLALTFSVNAAYKMKKDVNRQIPELLQGVGLDGDVGERTVVSNYHGFCRNVLRKYGYLFHPSLFDIDKLLSVDDGDTQRLMRAVKTLTYDDAVFLSSYSEQVKNINWSFLKDKLREYNARVINNLLPEKAITYNSILTLTLELFLKYPGILKFYHCYFTTILVDEYQDTNALSYWLVTLLMNDDSNVILLGDSLQRIYGFIGAVPDLLTISENKFGLKKIQLTQNHRFSSNPQMMQLDYNIRRNAENPSKPAIAKDAVVKLGVKPDQEAESLYIVETARTLLDENAGSKVAILVRQRGPNTDLIINTFEKNNIPYFFALFTDEEPSYVAFHTECLSQFTSLIGTRERVTRSLSRSHVQRIREHFNLGISHLNDALISLLEIFWEKVFTDFSFMTNEEKTQLIKDTFEYNSLRQYIEFTSSDIIISTVHAAKGLEWDFVLLPDMEQSRFPGWQALCSKWACRADCRLLVTPEMERAFLEELSVFYVGVTRARKQVYFSASETSLDTQGNIRSCNVSCFLKLRGITTSTK